MIAVSDRFKELMREPIKAIQMCVTTNEPTPQTFASSDVLASVDIEADGYFFGAVTESLTMKLIGTDYNLVGYDVKPLLQALSDAESETYENLNYNSFRIYEQTVDLEKGITTVKGYDAIGFAAKLEYSEGGLAWPCTVADLASQVASRIGVQLATDMSSLPNHDYVISEDLYATITGTTFRNILAEIAGATASICRISDDKLVFEPALADVVDTLTYDNLLKVKFEPRYGNVSSVVLARTPQEDNIVVVDEDTVAAASGKNFFNPEVVTFGSNESEPVISGDTITISRSGQSAGFKYRAFPIQDGLKLLGKTITINGSWETDGNYNSCIRVFWLKNNNTALLSSQNSALVAESVFAENGEHSFTFTLPENLPTNASGFGVLLYSVQQPNQTTASTVFHNIQLELGASATSYESFRPNGLVELKLANNEILDDDRELLAAPILTAVDGFFFDPCEATTEGHGWYECGDRVQISNDTTDYETIITHTKLTFSGGIKEVIKGVSPDATKTDYALAGGITKTIYNTEIKVDKQGQRIESIVEEQRTLDNKVNNNFTSITQNISEVVTSVQNSGGNNLIKNSAMYSLDNNSGEPLEWSLSGEGTITIAPSSEAAVNGSLSRQNISLKGKTASQVIAVKADTSSTTDKTYYSFSCKIKKTAAGECLVRITDGTEKGVWEIALNNGDQSFYKDYSIEKILPNSSNLTISVYGSADSEFSITDMMLAVGDYKSQWTQANGEFANTQVTIDSNGVTIRSNNLNGTYSKQTSQELSTYSNNRLVATVNDDGVSAPRIDATKAISMPPLKIVPRSDGWAFVKA